MSIHSLRNPGGAPSSGLPEVAAAACAADELLGLRRNIDSYLSAFVASELGPDRLPTLVAPYAADLGDYVLRSGKRLRPLLFLLACRAFRGETASSEPFEIQHLAAACSLELFHDFVLIHDDLIDESDSRRGAPALHRVIQARLASTGDSSRADANSRCMALVLGDILFALAQRCLLESGFPNRAEMAVRLLGYVVDTGWGEELDILGGTVALESFGLAQIEEMYLLKTTRYSVECPLVLAAMVSGLDDEAIASIPSIAEPAGLAFQIENDLRAFYATGLDGTAESGDLFQRKRTALLHATYQMLDHGGRVELLKAAKAEPQTPETVRIARDLIERSGAPARMRQMADSLFSSSVKKAADAPLPTEVREGLRALVALVRRLAAS